MMGKLWKENMIPRKVKMELYGREVTTDVVYGSGTRSLSAFERRKLNIFETIPLKNTSGIRRIN